MVSKVGTRVFCYYDEVVPLITGTVINNEPAYEDKPYTRVHQDFGGTIYIPNECVFYSMEDWKKHYEAQRKQLEKELERLEYDTYLALKEKYEKRSEMIEN